MKMERIKPQVEEKKLGKWGAAIMLFTSPTLISPFLVILGGPWSYVLIYLTVFLIILSCGIIISKCSVMALSHYGEKEMKLGAYSKIIKLAFGEKSVSFMVVFQIFVLLSMYSSLLLINGSVLSDMLPTESIAKENTIRIGVCISTLLIVPFIFKSSLHELGITAIFSTLAKMLCTLLVQIICFHISRSDVKLNMAKYDLTNTSIAYRFFNITGTMLFFTSTSGFILPPLITSINKPKEQISAFTLAFIATLIASFITAFIPYFFLSKDYIHPSIITTLVAYQDNSILYQVLKYLICITLIFYHSLDCVFTIYPCFFLMQIWLNITEEQTWKRNSMRLTFVLVMCGASIIFTSIRAVLSLLGGAPIVIYNIVIPLCCYYKLSTSEFQPMLLYVVIGVFSIILIIGSLVTDTQYLLANDN